MTPPPLDILYSDNHLIAVNKPAGLLTQSSSSDADSLLERTRYWIKEDSGKPGNVFLGMVHRLDRPVAGVVLFARTSKAAGRLSRQFREHEVQKIYRACVEGIPKPDEGTLTHYLRKEKSRKTTVFPRPTPEAKQAELIYRLLQSSDEISELEVTLKTGRFHQIRAQLSFIGHPILGDTLYRSGHSWLPGQIALYARQLTFTHPIQGETVVLTCPPPSNWPMESIHPE